MGGKKKSDGKISGLRDKAERALRGESHHTPDLQDPSLPIEEMGRLIHELRVHQIELEMQNEELRRAHNDLEVLKDKYLELYDFAPVGYLSLNRRGIINEANLGACRLMGIDRSRLIQQPLSRFVMAGDQDAYYLHYQEVLHNLSCQSLAVRMVRTDGSVFHAQLETVPVRDEQEEITGFRTVLFDITERKQMEQELSRASDELEQRVQERTSQLAEANRNLGAEVAERLNAESAVREKNELLERILSTVHLLIAFLDQDFNFVRVNDAYAEADGHTPEFFIGRNLFELYPHEEHEAIFRKVVETGLSYFAEQESFQYPEHSERATSYWDWSLQPVKGDSGRVTGLVLCLINVTKHRHAQAALRESEDLLRSVLKTLPVGVWITDQSGLIVMANPAADELWAGARYVGMGQYGEYKGWWADTGKPIAADEWAAARAVTRGEVSIDEVVDIQCFDGTRKTILNSALPIYNEHNEILRVVVVNQDVTKLRQIETALRRSEEGLRQNIELLQKVVDGITDPLIMLDREGLVTMINKASMNYYGVGQSMDVLGKPCFQGLRGREAACPECDYPFSTAGRQTVAFDRKGLNDAGKVENVTVYPVLGESGRREATIIKISDVTQAKMIERQILQNEKLASLGLLTSGIAHEINNPNSFIYFNIPILRKYLEELMPILDEYAALHPDFEVLHMSYGDLREDIFKLLENMEHGSQRINKIVGALKSFVRKRETEWIQKFDLKQLIDKVLTFCHTELTRRVKTFEVLVPEELPPIVSDAEALEQVLLNLLINAIHACDKQDSWIRLKVERGYSGRDDFILEISDNGSGIEETLRDRIFDPFFTTKPSTMGTGLGLYICHLHVESLGGSIEVESNVGQGSTFRILLPQRDK
jgi:PAS domain S-box-containing protein